MIFEIQKELGTYSTQIFNLFDTYFIYNKHFFDNSVTGKEHGLMYYYLHALNYDIFYKLKNNIMIYL